MPRQAGYANPSANKSDKHFMGLDREAQRAQEPTCKRVPHECDPFHDARRARKRARMQYGLINVVQHVMMKAQANVNAGMSCRDPDDLRGTTRPNRRRRIKLTTKIHDL
jgi:hypothetical protein